MFSASRFDRRRTRNCVFKFNRLRVAPNEQRYAFRMNFFVVQIFGNYSFLFRLLWMWCRLTLTAESTAIDKDYVAQLARQTCGFRVIDALIFVRSRIKCVPNDRLPSFPFIYFVFFFSPLLPLALLFVFLFGNCSRMRWVRCGKLIGMHWHSNKQNSIYFAAYKVASVDRFVCPWVCTRNEKSLRVIDFSRFAN